MTNEALALVSLIGLVTGPLVGYLLGRRDGDVRGFDRGHDEGLRAGYALGREAESAALRSGEVHAVVHVAPGEFERAVRAVAQSEADLDVPLGAIPARPSPPPAPLPRLPRGEHETTLSTTFDALETDVKKDLAKMKESASKAIRSPGKPPPPIRGSLESDLRRLPKKGEYDR